MRTSLMALGVGVVSAIGVAGCGSDASTNATSTSTTSARVAAKTAATGVTSTSTTQPFVSNSKNTPGTLANFVGAHGDVHDTTCKQDGDSWNASGMVTNPTAKAVQYRIYVSFLNGDTTVGLAEVNVGKVNAKKSQGWQQGVKVAGKDLRCILRVERADL